MNYKNKYLKYKLKYLKLIQSSGNISEGDFKHNCFTKIFENYEGECWNDSIQTILTFTEPFINIQKKAIINYNSSIEFLVDQIIENAFRNRLHLKPLHLNYSNNIKDLKAIDRENDNTFKQYIRGYIVRLLKRFKILYNKKYSNQIITKQINDENLSITCALNALKFSEINKIIDNNENKNRNRNNHGGYMFNNIFTLNSLSFILLENNNFINMDLYEYKSNNETYHNLKMKNMDLIQNIDIDINKYFGINISINGHAFCVYKCPENKMYYYDDNNIESIEFDWNTYLKKNHKTLESLENIDKLKYYQLTFLINNNIETRLGYFNKESNQLLIYDTNLNEYKIFNNYIEDELLIIDELNNIKIISINKIIHMYGYYIDTALNREEYVNKLQLEYYLYTNNYNLKIAKAYAIHDFPIIINNDSNEHRNILYAISYFKSALILNHENIINKIYENIFFLKKINIDTNQPYLFEIYFFNNMSIIENFITKINLDEDLLYNYIYNILINNNNSTMNIELFIKYNTNSKFKDKFKDNIIKLIDNIYEFDDDNEDNYDYFKELILYFLKNNTNNILSINFNIDNKNNNNNNEMLLYYLLRKCENLNKKYKLINDIITYFNSNWKLEYKILFENIDINKFNILYDIFSIEEKHNFKLIDKLYKLKKERNINIFNNNSKSIYFLKYYSLSYLKPKSQTIIQTILEEIIEDKDKNKNKDKNKDKEYIENNIDSIIQTHTRFFEEEQNIIQKNNIQNLIKILENIKKKIKK
jgi:hypothetical protein